MSRGPIYSVMAPAMHGAARALGLHRRALRQPIEVRRERVALDLGIRVVLAADLHADRDFMPRSRVAQVVDLINSVEDVDLVAMPGDFVGHDLSAIDWVAEELGRLHAPAFATLGNHDHMEGAEYVTAALAGAGVHMLTQQAVPLDFVATPDLWIIGLDSMRAGGPRSGVIDDAAPEGARCIVLGHEPALALRHLHALHLAGHTHHGQIRLRGLPHPYLPAHSRPYPEGLATVTGSEPPRYVYTTAGLGSTTVPLRIGAPPEIVVLDL